MRRTRPDGSVLSWRLLVPRGDSYRRPWPFFIQGDQPDQERLVAERAGEHPNRVTAVAGVEIGVRDVARAQAWYEPMGMASTSSETSLGGFQVKLTRSSEDGPTVVTLASSDLAVTAAVLRAGGEAVEMQADGALLLTSGPLAGSLRFIAGNE
jgi:hypothetical protein